MTLQDPRDREAILRKAHEWRVLIEGPHATQADRTAFEAWRLADPRHDDLYDVAITFHEAMGTVSANDLAADVLKPTAWEHVRAVKARIGSLISAKTCPRFIALGSVFAALLMCVVALAQLRFEQTSDTRLERHATAIGETRRVNLSDGTALTLSAASVVEIAYSRDAREATLISGAAFFDVASAPDRPFFVNADEVTAKALGTQFDVRRQGDVVRVAVAEGVVEVSAPFVLDGAPTSLRARRKLAAGEQVAAREDEGLQPVENVPLAAIGAWRNDKLYYDGVSLWELVEEADRYVHARVVVEGDAEALSGFRIRGSFNARDVDGMLSTLADIYPVHIDRSEPGVIRIRERRGAAP